MSYFERLLADDQTLHGVPVSAVDALAGRYNGYMNLLLEVDPEASNDFPEDADFHVLPLDTQRAMISSVAISIDDAVNELTDGVWRFDAHTGQLVRPAFI